MKKLQYFGGILLLIFLIIFDIGIYARIFGIQGPSIITVATGFLDAIDERKESRTDKTEGHSGASTPNEKKGDATATPAASRDGKSGRANAAGAKTDESRKAAGSGNTSTSGGGVSNTNNPSAADKTSGDASNAAASKGLTSDSSLADIMGYPSYSILNGPEGIFLTQIAGYDDNDYSYTMVTACIPPDGSIADKPAPVSLPVPTDEPGRTYEVQVYSSRERKIVYVGRGIPSGGSAEIYNLTPGDICGYQIFVEEYVSPENGRIMNSRLITSECFQVNPYEMRGIRTESLNNVRDLGGWSTLDGRHVKYGLLYRGSAFDGGGAKTISDSDVALLKDRLGIRNELDLRWDSEIMLDGSSTLGDDIHYLRVPMQLYLEFVSNEENGGQLNQFFDMLNLDGPLYYHCAIGCDRTGTLSFLLLGLLGVSESDINKEYELSSFSVYGPRTRDNGETYYKEMVAYIKENSQGSTLAEKIQNYLLSRGVSQEKIDTFKSKMLE